MMYTPRSRMNILNSQEIEKLVARSQLVTKYAQTIDRDSAHEMLSRKIDLIQRSNGETKNNKRRTNIIPNQFPIEDYRQGGSAASSTVWQRPTTTKKRRKQTRRNASNYMSTPNISTLETVLNSAASREVGKTTANAFTRGLLGTLGLNTANRARHTNRKRIKRQNIVPNWFG